MELVYGPSVLPGGAPDDPAIGKEDEMEGRAVLGYAITPTEVPEAAEDDGEGEGARRRGGEGTFLLQVFVARPGFGGRERGRFGRLGTAARARRRPGLLRPCTAMRPASARLDPPPHPDTPLPSPPPDRPTGLLAQALGIPDPSASADLWGPTWGPGSEWDRLRAAGWTGPDGRPGVDVPLMPLDSPGFGAPDDPVIEVPLPAGATLALVAEGAAAGEAAARRAAPESWDAAAEGAPRPPLFTDSGRRGGAPFLGARRRPKPQSRKHLLGGGGSCR